MPLVRRHCLVLRLADRAASVEGKERRAGKTSERVRGSLSLDGKRAGGGGGGGSSREPSLAYFFCGRSRGEGGACASALPSLGVRSRRFVGGSADEVVRLLDEIHRRRCGVGMDDVSCVKLDVNSCRPFRRAKVRGREGVNYGRSEREALA